MDKEFGTLELDSALRLSIVFGSHSAQSVQLSRDDARRLGVALIELANKDVTTGHRIGTGHKICYLDAKASPPKVLRPGVAYL